MSDKLLAILLGGLIPAVILGLFGFLQKACLRNGASSPAYFTIVGLTVGLLGAIYWMILRQPLPGMRATLTCVAAGGAWFLGSVLIIESLRRFDVSISQLTPLYNMNTLVVVLLGMVVYAEWRDVRILPLLLGALLIIVGGTLVARA